MNRGELRTFLQLLGKRTDATDDMVNDFIEQGELLIYATARVREMVADPVTLDENDREASGRYTLPSDFLGVRIIWDAEGHPMQNVSLDELRRITASSAPIRYSIYGFNIEFRGVPGTDATFDVVYYGRPTVMDDDADEPAMLIAYPQMFINAAMFYYRMWSEDPELASAHREALTSEIDDANAVESKHVGALHTGIANNLGNYRLGSSM